MSSATPRFVYVASDGPGRTKVGMTGNIKLRRQELAPFKQSPFLIMEWHTAARADAPFVEGAAHNALLPHRINGEWFAVSVGDAIEAVRRAEVQADAGSITEIWRLPPNAPRRKPQTKRPFQRKVMVGVNLSRAEKLAAETEAKRDNRSLSNLIAYALKCYLEKNAQTPS